MKKYDIVRFQKSENKITQPITKFGGQPVGIRESQWPVSEGWADRKMMFVGQIFLILMLLSGVARKTRLLSSR